jgi:ribonuclease-3
MPRKSTLPHVPLASTPEIHALESALEYTFHDRQLLQLALTHRSYVFETPGVPNATNERLEFLGDAVLAYITADHLYRTYPQLTEGELTDVRAVLVKAPTLASFARQINLGPCLRMGKGEEMTGGRDRDPLLAAAFEALLGALVLDGGMHIATTFILKLIMPEAHETISNRRFKDDKSLLQELSQAQLGLTPSYAVVAESGPSHQRIYTIEVHIGSLVAGSGTGTSKQRAEQDAARDALSHDGWRNSHNPTLPDTSQ